MGYDDPLSLLIWYLMQNVVLYVVSLRPLCLISAYCSLANRLCKIVGMMRIVIQRVQADVIRVWMTRRQGEFEVNSGDSWAEARENIDEC